MWRMSVFCGVVAVEVLMAGCSGEVPPRGMKLCPAEQPDCICGPAASAQIRCGPDAAVHAAMNQLDGAAASQASSNDAVATVAIPTHTASADAGLVMDSPDATDAPEVVAEPRDQASYVFDVSQLRTYNLIVSPSDLALIDRRPVAELYVPASLEFEGKTYGPYRMRYKGRAGAFEPPCTLTGIAAPTPKIGKCSIKIDFRFKGSGERFFGLEKLNFHAMGQDDSMLRESLGYSLFRDMGIPASRTAHARLLINGQLEGLFVLVEQIDDRFTRTRFREGGRGNIYKEVWPTYDDLSVYEAALENHTSTPQVQRMYELHEAVETDADELAKHIDREYMLRYLAVDRVIENDDGIFHFFCGSPAQGNNPGPWGNHNYYWYEAEAASRFWLIPWDLDFVLEGRIDNQVQPEWTVDAPCVCANALYGRQRPASCDPVVQHLRAWAADYDQKVDAFIAGPFAAEPVDAKLDQWIATIRDAVAEASGLNGAPTIAGWERAVATLRAKIANARRNRGRAY